MNLLSFEGVSLTLGDTSLFEDVTLGIEAGEKIGFIGPNGAGKSTLLSLITAERACDEGTIHRRSDLTISYLPQIPQTFPGFTVADLVFQASDPRAALVREYESLLERYAGNDQLAGSISDLQTRMDHENAWNLENTYHSFLTELGIHDLSRPIETLSGGELRKADLARVLASGADLLILDEPTNHLDLETVEWLEAWLRNGRRSYILVTHDRTFLDRSCDVILELEEKTVRKYQGNWSTYLARKTKRLEEEARSAEKRDNILKRELEWASRQPKARGTKDKKRLARIDDLMDTPQSDQHRLAEFSSRGRRLGKKVLELVNVTKSRGNRLVIAPFSYSFKRGERIGIAGPNGSGKTTLMSLASGILEMDSGRIDIGVNTRFAVLDQSALAADPDETVLTYMKNQAEHVLTADGNLVDVSRWLERFGFPVAACKRQIRYLSGGERRRLQLVQLLMSEPNFLVLDEPTNDLDLLTLGLLESFLEEFEGCLLLVSHDRTFLERVTDYLLILDGSGTVRGFSGSWSEYRELQQEGVKKRTVSADRPRQGRSSKKGLNFNEKKRMEELMNEVLGLEDELKTLELLFSNPSVTQDELAEAGRRHPRLKAEIDEKTVLWEELAAREES